ncbi:MAG: nucleotidyltransferase family protein [Coriobacteriia bacterium]
MEKVRKVMIRPGLTVKQAIRAMDDAAERILIVTDDEDRLIGVVTDGDVRRWILAGKSLDGCLDEVMNTHPRSLPADYTIEQAKEAMITTRKECLPVIDEGGHVISAVWWMDLFEKRIAEHKHIDLPVVIMAGGEGTRLAPFTKVLPKPLMPIGDTPIVELIIEHFTAYGCTDFHLSVNYKADLIRAYFADLQHDYHMDYVVEDEPLGTAGSLALLRGRLTSTFFVTNCDVLVEADYSDIARFHREHGDIVTLVGSMKQFTIPYGVCDMGDNGTLKLINEKPEYNFLVSTGFAILEPEALDAIPAGRMYHMTDLVNDLIAAGKKVGVYPVSEKSWLDMGQWEELQEMLKRFGTA